MSTFVYVGLAAQQMFGFNSGIQPCNECLVQALP